MRHRLLAPILASLLSLGAALIAVPLVAVPLVAHETAAPAPTIEALDFESGAYKVDPLHSTVIFGLTHLGVANFYGRFNKLEGSFSIDADDPSKCTVSVQIDPASVDTNSDDRDGHVKHPDFLDVETFDELSYRSTSVTASSGDSLTVVGQFTMHGVSREVTAEVSLVGQGDTVFGPRAGVEARLTVQRSDFGMATMLDKLGDEIELIVSLEGMLQK